MVMGDNERITKLEAEVAELRAAAEQADASLALMIGLLMESSTSKFQFDAAGVLNAMMNHPWAATLVERMSAGQEAVRQARNGPL